MTAEENNDVSALPAVPEKETKSNLQLVAPIALGVMEQVIIKGNLALLQPMERVNYYMETCRSIGLNPLTQPFGYIELDGKDKEKVLTLYAKRDATDQLRRIYSVTTKIVSRETIDGVYIVTAEGRLPDGRTDESIGAVPLVKEGGNWKTSDNGRRFFEADGKFIPLSPDARANAIMKAETKAKRRLTLSICGLGWLDESETDSMRNARFVDVDHATGEVVASTPVANRNAIPESTGSSEISDWNVFWKRAKAKKIDKDVFTDLVGNAPQSFPNPQAAWDALIAAETAMMGGAGQEPAASDSVEGEYREVNQETGEIGETDYEAVAQE